MQNNYDHWHDEYTLIFMKKNIVNLAIFASGSGTNAEAIINYFDGNPDVNICRIYSNNPKAFVLERAKKFGIPHTTFNRKEFYESTVVLDSLMKDQTDLIVLAGFMWLFPEYLIHNFPKKIINIHPALLPAYGGKGMYGQYVHEAVILNKERKSGITIHFVNQVYDEGEIVFQAECPVTASNTPEDLAQKIHSLEHQHYPRIIEELVNTIKNKS